jgi:hypothetical protein
MGMSQMRGTLADAIRAVDSRSVRKHLIDYENANRPNYLERGRTETLKNAKLLTKRLQKRLEDILADIEKVQEIRSAILLARANDKQEHSD